MKDPSEIPFQEVLDALLDETEPFKPLFVYRFSGLSSPERRLLEKNWEKVPAQRRRNLLEDIENFAEADPLLSFESVCMLGIKDRDPQVRLISIRTLWENQSLDLAQTLLEILAQDEDAEVRAGAASALGNYVYLGEIEEIPSSLKQTVEERLLQTARSKEPTLVRRRALEALGYSCRAEIPSLIEQAYDSDEDEWLISALFAMGRSASTGWKKDVLAMLDHKNPLVRMEAARAAGELEIQEAVEPLLDLLQDLDDGARAAAIWSLSQIGGEHVAEQLEELLEESEDEDEIRLLEDALDNLAFIQGLPSFSLFEFSEDDLHDSIHEIDLMDRDEEDR